MPGQVHSKGGAQDDDGVNNPNSKQSAQCQWAQRGAHIFSLLMQYLEVSLNASATTAIAACDRECYRERGHANSSFSLRSEQKGPDLWPTACGEWLKLELRGDIRMKGASWPTVQKACKLPPEQRTCCLIERAHGALCHIQGSS